MDFNLFVINFLIEIMHGSDCQKSIGYARSAEMPTGFPHLLAVKSSAPRFEILQEDIYIDS